ncbi:MAG TPA: hypothetical protein PLW14_09530 [Chlorobiota bacterium]|nr:hypothetical protein [Chlorobiota bacterium]
MTVLIRVVLIIISLCILSCESSSPTDSTGTPNSVYSIDGLYMFDEGEDWRVMFMNTSQTWMRKRYGKEFSLQELADDDDAAIRALHVNTVNGEKIFRFRSAQELDRYLSLGRTATVTGQEEYYMGVDRTNEPRVDDMDYDFVVHDIGRTDGRRVITIESFRHRGWYVSNGGHTLVGNGVRFEQHDTPESADHIHVDNVLIREAEVD